MIKHTDNLKCPFCVGRKVNCSEVLMGRTKQFPLDPENQHNLEYLLLKINLFRDKYNKPLIVSSGYRPSSINQAVGGAKKSAHQTCQAIDFIDKDGKIKEFLKQNPNLLEELDLYQEHPDYTKTWVHLQTRKTKSGKRIFIP